MALRVRAVQLVNIAGMLSIVCIQTKYRIFSLPIIMSPQGKSIHQSYFWYMEKVFMYSYNKLSLEWSELFTCSKKLGESISPSQGALLMSRTVEPLGSAPCNNHAQCTEQPLCISEGWTPVRAFGDQPFWKDSGGHRRCEKRYVLLPGSQGDVA